MLRTSIRRSHAARLGVAVLGGCVALAACGPVQMGAAAIAGGHRITTASLTTQVSSLQKAYRAEGRHAQLAFPASQMPQEVLAWLVRFEVREALARREGIHVSARQEQQAISQITAQARAGGQTATLTQLAIANGLPPDMISRLGEYQAIANAFVNRLDHGLPPASPAAQQAIGQEFDRAQCLAAKSLNIKINPRFGRMDYSTLGIVPAPDTLSAPESAGRPSAQPSAAPRYTPPC